MVQAQVSDLKPKVMTRPSNLLRSGCDLAPPCWLMAVNFPAQVIGSADRMYGEPHPGDDLTGDLRSAGPGLIASCNVDSRSTRSDPRLDRMTIRSALAHENNKVEGRVLLLDLETCHQSCLGLDWSRPTHASSRRPSTTHAWSCWQRTIQLTAVGRASIQQCLEYDGNTTRCPDRRIL